MRKYLLMFILLGSLIQNYGQDKNEILKLSISEAQAFALQNNRDVQSSKIDIKSADKQIWENLATGLPQVNVAANYLHQFQIPVLPFGIDFNSIPDGLINKSDLVNAFKNAPPISLGVKNNTVIDFTVSQLIFSGEYLVGLQATKVVKEMSEKSLVKTENQTKESVADTYYLILVLDGKRKSFERKSAGN